MASQSGIWLYRSIERQGSYRLVLVVNDEGKVRAQRQRFNADGTSVPFSAGDLFSGEDLKEAIEWLNQHHLTLTLRGWKIAVTSGAANNITLCSAEATRQGARRLRNLRSARATPATRVRLEAATA